MRGQLITFEGGEGTGKSTQMERLRDRLEEQGYDVLTTREPGGSPGAEAVRHVVLSGAAEAFGPQMEAVLFAAARRDNVEQIILPMLEQGGIVLCDRYMDSSRVYQGIAGEAGLDFVLAMERAVTEGARPDLTFIFDLDPAEGLKRASETWAGNGPDRFEKDDLERQETRRQAFLQIATDEPDRCVVIDASQPLENVSRQVDASVDAFLRKIERERAS